MTETLYRPVAEPYIHPDAPERHLEERRCEKGQDCVVYEQTARWGSPEAGKLSGYQRERHAGKQGTSGPLLCYRCIQREIDAELAAEEEKRARSREGSDPELAKAVGARIRKRREALGMTRSKLARTIGLNYPQQLYGYENGERLPRPRRLIALAEALGTSVAELKGEIFREAS